MASRRPRCFDFRAHAHTHTHTTPTLSSSRNVSARPRHLTTDNYGLKRFQSILLAPRAESIATSGLPEASNFGAKMCCVKMCPRIPAAPHVSVRFFIQNELPFVWGRLCVCVRIQICILTHTKVVIWPDEKLGRTSPTTFDETRRGGDALKSIAHFNSIASSGL